VENKKGQMDELAMLLLCKRKHVENKIIKDFQWYHYNK
jgi:hypothetical protein